MLGTALPATAQSGGGAGGGTPAGTWITNAASVQATVGGSTIEVVSDTVLVEVGQVVGVDVDPPRVASTAPGSESVFAHLLSNLGNGTDSFDVTATTPRGWLTRAFHDVDGDGGLSAADTLLTGPISLARGATFPLLVTAQVPAGMGQGEVEPVNVTANSRFDPAVQDALANEVRVDATAGPPPAQLGITKTVSKTAAATGDTLVFTINVSNPSAGSSQANLEVVDTLPNVFQAIESTPTADLVGQVHRWTIGTLEPGESAQLQIRALVGAVTGQLSVANRANLVQNGASLLTAVSGSVAIGPSVPTQLPVDVAVFKSADRASADRGELLTYTIEAQLRGPGVVSVLELRDVLPNGVEYEAGSLIVNGASAGDDLSDGAGYDANARALRVTLVNPTAGTTMMSFKARINASTAMGTRIDNVVLATMVRGDGTSRTVSSIATTVVDVLSVELEKTVSGKDTVTYGDTLVYTIEVRNTSAASFADGLYVVDTLPDYLTVIGNPTGVSVRAGGVVRWTPPSLGPGANARLDLVTRVGEPLDTVAAVNRAHAIRGGTVMDASETRAIVLVPAGPPELVFGKTVTGPNPVRPGSTLLYELTVVNPDSERSATNIEVVDTLPAILRSLETTPKAEVAGRVHRWTIERIAPGDTATLQIRARVGSTTARSFFVNRAQFTFGDEVIGEAETDTTTVDPLDESIDSVFVSLIKDVDRATATPTDLLTYTIRAQVSGSGPAVELVIQDALPEGVTYEAGSLEIERDGGTRDYDAVYYDAVARILDVRLDAPTVGEYIVRFQARIDAGTPFGTRLENVAVAEVLSPAPGAKRAQASAVTIVTAPDIAVRKSVSGKNPASVNDTILYTIEIENSSSDLVARDLEVVDTLPAYLSLLQSAPAAEVATEGVLRWLIPTLEPGAIRRFEVATLVGLVPDSVLAVNRVQLSSGGQVVGGAEAEGIALLSPDTARLALDLETEALVVQVGETLPLRVGVTNVGIVTVSDVRVTLSIPEGTSFIREILAGSFVGVRSSPTADLAQFGTASGPSPSAEPADGGAGQTSGLLTESPLQLDSFRVSGDSLLVWIPGELRPEESFQFRYKLLIENPPSSELQMRASAEGRRGNIAVAAGGRVVASNNDAVRVVLGRNRPLETRTALGKVFFDENQNGVQDDGESGVAGVEVWTEDGEVVIADADGKLSFQNLRPGRHAFRVDVLTVPAELAPAGIGLDRGLLVRETNGWNSGRLSFPLVSRVGVVVDSLSMQLPEGQSPEDGPATARLTLRPGAPVPEMVFQAPAGWRYVPGTAAVGGRTLEPEELHAPDGSRWLLWKNLPSDTAHVGLLIGQVAITRELPVEPVRVDALRTEEERADERGRAFLTGPGVEIFAPTDGAVVTTNKLFLGIRGEASKPAALYRDGVLLQEVVLRPDGVHDFLGLDVEPGPQLFRVRMTNSWGGERWDSVRVHRSGDPVRFVSTDERIRLVADGQTVGRVRVRVLDAWGVPVADEPAVSVFVDGAGILSPDSDAQALGHQVRVDPQGWVTLELAGGTEPRRGRVTLESGSAVLTLPIVVDPSVRPLFLTGVGQVSLGAGGEDFGAVTARGRLDDQTSITLSYDSRRLDQGRDAFGRASDPLEEGRYTLIGDASQQRSLSSSRYQLAARIERGQDWLMVGDVQSSGFSDGLGLGRYNRSVAGGAASLTTGRFTWNAFGASTSQALRQLQIRGTGSSGPFELGAGVLPGTESVRVEVRGRENPTRLISEERLERYVDYEIDYERGTLMLKRPAPSTDLAGNPLFIVVTFEGRSGGDESLLWGLRSNTDLGDLLQAVDSIPVSALVVRDHQAGSEFLMGALRAGIAQANGARLAAEVVVAEAEDSSDVAFRLEWALPLLDDRLKLQGQWTRIGDEFKNPSNRGALAGSEELRASASLEAVGSVFEATHEQQDFAATGVERRRTAIGVEREVQSGVTLDARLADEHSEKDGVESSSGAAEARATWQAKPRLRVFAEARGQLWSEGALATQGSHLGGGAAFEIFDDVELEARHLRVSPGDATDDYSVTTFGVTSQLRAGTRAWGNYQLTGGLDGATNAAVLGLNHQFALSPSWRFQTMLERRKGIINANPTDPIRATPFERPEENYTAAALGAEFVPESKPYRASFRTEAKEGSQISSRLFNVAGDISFDASLALLSKQELVSRTLKSEGTERYTRERSSLWGLAYRPTGRNDINVLFKLEWKDAINPFGTGVLTQDGEESRLVGAAEIIWAPLANLELGARIAARATRSQSEALAGAEIMRESETQFFGLRARLDLNPWLGLKVEGRGMSTNAGQGSVWDVAPAVLFRPIEGLQLEGGYRFGDLQDPDFAVKSGNGWYLSIGTSFTEQVLPTAAAFWRGRFGR